ncbi:hypothetical protein LJC71_10390 [Desulfosarcina sp. OttesenSCG-928-A07]|nr:hypothetical protein [Desulfosarcina sp. OttesenSCG-928-G17]MDL2330129.1 hypothetical protein [Desulfosarcina sp. OttesenSCG-928-A07]
MALTLSDYGDWTSIIGLMISLATFATVFLLKRQIKRRFIFHSNMESFIEKFQQASFDIVNCLNSFERNKETIHDIVEKINVHLRFAVRGAKGDLKNDLKKTQRQISCYTIRDKIGWIFSPQHQHARAISRSLNNLVDQIEYHRQELQISGD